MVQISIKYEQISPCISNYEIKLPDKIKAEWVDAWPAFDLFGIFPQVKNTCLLNLLKFTNETNGMHLGLQGMKRKGLVGIMAIGPMTHGKKMCLTFAP